MLLRCAGLLLFLRFIRPSAFELSPAELTALMTIFTLVLGSSVRSIKVGLSGD